jgi:hypothetical protein
VPTTLDWYWKWHAVKREIARARVLSNGRHVGDLPAPGPGAVAVLAEHREAAQAFLRSSRVEVILRELRTVGLKGGVRVANGNGELSLTINTNNWFGWPRLTRGAVQRCAELLVELASLEREQWPEATSMEE